MDKIAGRSRSNTKCKKLTMEERRYLQTKWGEGMQMCGHEDVPLVAERLCRPVKMIKNWISNYRQKIEGRIPQKEKKIKTYSHLSGFNVFVQERCQGIPMSEWHTEWRKLSQETRKTFKEKALKKKNEPTSREHPRAKLEKDLHRLTKLMEENGIEVACILNKDSKTSCIGSTRGLDFLLNSTDIITKFNEHLEKDDQRESYNAEKERLRKEVQNLFNYKYSLALGKVAIVPYSKYEKTYKVELPDNLKFSKPSNYGKQDKIKILQKPDEVVFKIVRNEGNTTDDQAFNLMQQHNVMDVEEDEEEHQLTRAEAFELMSQTNMDEPEEEIEEQEPAIAEDIEHLLRMVSHREKLNCTEVEKKEGKLSKNGPETLEFQQKKKIGAVIDDIRERNLQQKLLRKKLRS